MIIHARQAIDIYDPNIGRLELKYLETARIDDKWVENKFFCTLVDDGLIAYFKDNEKSSAVDEKIKAAEIRQIETEDKNDKQRALDEAIAKARNEAEEVSKIQGYDEIRKESIINNYVQKAVEEVEKQFSSNVNEDSNTAKKKSKDKSKE
nr:MAG TPA: hypothetical protein [Caudoviricetes sp.]